MSGSRGGQSEVTVRFVRTQALEDALLASRAREILGTAERQALARLRPDAARRDYLAAHALARMMLAELAGCEPARVHLRYSPRGRPMFIPRPGASSLRFSISHADGVALCAVAERHAVGADVESLRNVGPDPLGVAGVVCSLPERNALRALPAAGLTTRLLSIWARKEAVAKATGLGFYFPPESIVLSADDGEPRAVELDSGGTLFGWIASWRLTPDHVAAVAVLTAPREQVGIRFEEAVPRVGAPWALQPI